MHHNNKGNNVYHFNSCDTIFEMKSNYVQSAHVYLLFKTRFRKKYEKIAAYKALCSHDKILVFLICKVFLCVMPKTGIYSRRYNNCSKIENSKSVSFCLIKCNKACKMVSDTKMLKNILQYCSMYNSRTNGHHRPVINYVNLFKPNGISHCYQLDESISVLGIVGWCVFLFKFEGSGDDPDQTQRSAASGLCLHCLVIYHKKDARFEWVMTDVAEHNFNWKGVVKLYSFFLFFYIIL